MIDIHCHILPNVDDGPNDVELSLAMARHAVQEGVTHVIATPHHRNGQYMNTKNEIVSFVQAFQEQLRQEDIPLTILPGQETRIHGDMVEEFKEGSLLTLNDTGKYLFVEFPSNDVPRYTKQLFFNLKLKGLIPVIVHPERNRAIMDDPNRLYKLVKDGALAQVTAGSLIGRFGKKIRELSFRLIEHSHIHFIASDAHNVTTRSFHMREAYDTLEDEFGSDIVEEFQHNAKHLIAGEDIYVIEPLEMKKRKRFRLF